MTQPKVDNKWVEEKTAVNPSYDKSVPMEKRLYDFLGKYHILLNGVVAHEPFYLKHEGKPNQRCDDESKKRLVDFALYLITQTQQDTLEWCEKKVAKLIKADGPWTAEYVCCNVAFDKGYNEALDEMRQTIKKKMGRLE